MTSLGTTSSGDDLTLDLDRLIGSHACIVANSGGGKSGLIRRLLEVTHGHVQQIVLDIEDEFYTLREHFDYVIAGGEGGDAPATVNGASALAMAALTHGFSLIVQLNDLGPEDAPRFVGRFLDALISAPRDLWRPVLVVLDEAQRFAPQDGVTAATHGVRALTAQGRKRGFTAVLASQRIAKIDADVRGDVNNWLLGRVGQTLDRKTMADALGFAPSSAEARGLQGLPDRTFWGFGPALSRTPTLFRVANVETTPVRPGQAKVATPPPPEALREILAALAVQPDPVATATEGTGDSDQNVKSDDDMIKSYPEFVAMRADRDAFEQRALRAESLLSSIMSATSNFEQAWREAGEMWGLVDSYRCGINLNLIEHGWQPPREAEEDDFDPEASLADVEPEAIRKFIAAPATEPAKVSTGRPSPAALAIADLLDRINPARVTWSQAAALTGRKASGGNFNAARKWLRESGRIVEAGEAIWSNLDAAAGMTRGEALDLWKSVLTNPAPKMIDALASCAIAIGKDDLGRMIGAVARGGNFNNGLAQLRRNGLLTDVGGGFRLADPLPGESS